MFSLNVLRIPSIFHYSILEFLSSCVHSHPSQHTHTSHVVLSEFRAVHKLCSLAGHSMDRLYQYTKPGSEERLLHSSRGHCVQVRVHIIVPA